MVMGLQRTRAGAKVAEDEALISRWKETAMGDFIGFAEVAGAVIGAFGLALVLEWVSLYGLTSMMPGRQNQPRSGAKSDI